MKYLKKRDIILAIGAFALVIGLVFTSPWLLLCLFGVLLIHLWWVTE